MQALTHTLKTMTNQISTNAASPNPLDLIENTEPERSYIIEKHKDQPAARKARLIIQDILGYNNQLRLNELTNEIEIHGKGIKNHQWEDLHHSLDKEISILFSKPDAQSAVRFVANENRYHPVKEYLLCQAVNAEQIDLNLVATSCLGVNDDLSTILVKKWLCGAVSKALEAEGSKFIEVLTLLSPHQGIGKSEFFKTLASPAWFNDSFCQQDSDKDRILSLQSSWINEIAEVDQYAARKQDFKQLKSLVSATADNIRPPYGTKTELKPRRFVLGATANSELLFPADDQQRRFWPIKVQPTTTCNRLDIKWLEENRDAIWGTATRLYLKEGDSAFTLSTDARSLVIARNADQFTQTSILEEKIAPFLLEKSIQSISTAEVWESILRYKNKPSKADEMDIGKILRKEGYERKKNIYKLGKFFSSIWVHPDRTHEFDPSFGLDY
jgi:predicted P-loop ATPase